MRKLLTFLLFMLVTMTVFTQVADAARFGGGRSFGVSRNISSFKSAPSAFERTASQAARPAGNRWAGPLAGLVAGGLLATLFMGHGIGSGLMSWLAIAAIGMFAWSFIRNRLQMSPSYSQSSQASQFSQSNTSAFTGNTFASAPQEAAAPVGFDATAFLRSAKVEFMRLQAAYDSKNLNDLREFCSPEVFGEIQLQLQERGDAPNQTEVVSLNALLLETVSQAEGLIVSVQFSGFIKENTDPEKSFNEIWHFSKENTATTWIVTGVQQN